MIQACNPQCKYVFLHTAIRVVIEPGSETDWSTSLAGNHADLLEIVLDEGDSLIDAALSVWYRLVGPLREFAGVKNRGRQILELEQIARADLDGLNRLHHERASATQRRVGRRVAALWEFRSWRRTSRFYLARLWLALGTLERLRRAWRDDYLSFLRSIEEEHVQDLFTIDSYEEVRMIDELDLSLIESAVQHADDRLSSNILALATAGGAIAGAVVAGLISLH